MRIERGVDVDGDALPAGLVQEAGIKTRPGCLENRSSIGSHSQPPCVGIKVTG